MLQTLKRAGALVGIGLFLAACDPSPAASVPAASAPAAKTRPIVDSPRARHLCETVQPGVPFQVVAAYDSTAGSVVKFEQLYAPRSNSVWASRPASDYVAVCYLQTNDEFAIPGPPGSPRMDALCVVIAPDGTQEIDRASTKAKMQLLRP